MAPITCILEDLPEKIGNFRSKNKLVKGRLNFYYYTFQFNKKVMNVPSFLSPFSHFFGFCMG